MLITFLLGSLVFVGAANGQASTATIDQAAQALRTTPVYVDPDAERAISEDEAERLLQAIRDNDAGPLYVALLPASAAAEAGGDPEAALAELARAVGEPGTYAAVIGDSFRAGAVGGVLPAGAAGSLATEAFDAQSGARI